MEYTVDQIKNILMDYQSFTEPEIVLGCNNSVYEICVMSDICSVTSYSQKIVHANISFQELFAPNYEVLGLCLERDWKSSTIFRCVPDITEPNKVIQRYLTEKRSFPNQQIWSEAVLNYCLKYLSDTYGESWIREEPAKQDIPYFKLDDGSYLALTYIRSMHGIIVEIADNKDDAYNYGFEEAENIYEGFDHVDALRLLKDTISDCWSNYRMQLGL